MAFQKRPGFQREEVFTIDDTVYTDADGVQWARVTTDPNARGNRDESSTSTTLEEIRELLKLQNEILKGFF